MEIASIESGKECSLESMEVGISKVTLALEKLISGKVFNIEDTKKKKVEMRQMIQKARESIIKHIDSLIKTLELEIDNKSLKLIERIRKDKSKLQNKMDETNLLFKDIEKVRNSENYSRLSDEMSKLDTRYRAIQEYVQNIERDDNHFEIHLKLSEIVFDFERIFCSMGNLVVSEKSMTSYLNGVKETRFISKSRKEKPMQTISGGKNKSKLVLVSCFPTSQLGASVKIFRASFLPNNTILLAGYQEKTLYICNKLGRDCRKIRVANFPGGIALYNKTCALVTAWQNGIQKIDLQSCKAGEVIKVRGESSAISCYDTQICVKNGEDYLSVVDVRGRVIRKMPTQYNPWEIFLSENGCVFYSNLTNSDIHCVFPDGSNYITYSNPDLVDPAGLTIDNQENLYISGSRSHNIHRISDDRKIRDVVLSGEDGIQNPTGMAFDKQTNELIIVNKDFTEIRIYKVCYEDDV